MAARDQGRQELREGQRCRRRHAEPPGVASRMFEAIGSQNINIHMISTSEIKISVIIDKADADRAVAAIHDAFIQ